MGATGSRYSPNVTDRGLPARHQWMRYSFTFFGNAEGAAKAAASLRQSGFDPVDVDEETSGDGYWHVAAFKVGDFPEPELRALAERFGGQYVDCTPAVLGDGSTPEPDRPLR
jgi:hypothetical protein